jgi:chitosanase
MATDIDSSNLGAQLKDAFANADKTAAERVQHLQWLHQSRASQLSRTASELKAEYGANDARVKRAEASLAVAKAVSAHLAVVHQEITTAEPEVMPGGWAVHGRVFTVERKPVRGFTVFLVDAVNAYQDAYGFAYTDDTGYFLLKYRGGGDTSTGTAAEEARVSELFLQVADLDARPVYLSDSPFSPPKGVAVYQNIVLSKGTQPLGEPPAQSRRVAPPKGATARVAPGHAGQERVIIMQLTEQQKRICEQVINAFETGSAEGDYAALVVLADGPHGVRQITYGRSQTTEYGNLEKLVQMYADANAMFSAQLGPFVPQIGLIPLADNKEFKELLRGAGKTDPVMRAVQDDFFDAQYFQPAMQWANANQFILPLSALVIYDSFIHSGGILGFLRKRFPEVLPAEGGDEKIWIREYVDTRHEWLATHPKKLLQSTVYRTQCLKREIARDNWALSQLPIDANGVDITGQ